MPFFPPTGDTVVSTQIPFDVKQYGAVGNGVANDTAAIQAAITAAAAAATNSWYFTVYFPQGTYLTTSSLTWTGSGRFYGDGPNSSLITGTFNGYIFDENDNANSAGSGPTVFENIGVNNTNTSTTTAGCIRVANGKVGLTITNCIIHAAATGVTHNGLGGLQGGGIFDVNLVSNKFIALNQSTSVGVRMNLGGGYLDVGNEFESWFVGRQLSGQGANISGGRQEANVTANLFGIDPNGDALSLSHVKFGDVQFEANTITLDLRWVSDGTFSSIGGAIGEDPPQLVTTYGIKLGNCDRCVFNSCVIDGVINVAAISVSVNVTNVTFIECHAGTTVTNAAGWDVNCDPTALRFIGCNYSPPSGAANTQNNAIVLGNAQATRGIVGVNYLTGTVAPVNLSGVAAVGSAATSVSVVFPAVENTGLALISSLTGSAGGSLTLLGAYHYLVSVVTETGEASGSALSATTLTGSNRTITVALSSTSYATPYRKRLYRGTGLTGTYDGFWDLTAGNVTTFVDTGAVAFTGHKQPGPAGNTRASAEVDGGYSVLVTPGWDTRVWITGQATTGFTIHFSSAPGSDTTVGWFLYR